MAIPNPTLRPTLWPGGLGNLVPPPVIFDAAVSEQHGQSFAISSSPLENGAVVTDHVLPQPQTLTTEVVLTDHPELPGIPSPEKHKQDWLKLLAIAETRQPFDFSTTLRVYTGMILESVSAPRSVETGARLTVTLRMRKLEIATIDQAQVLADAMVTIALGEQDIGQVAMEAAEAAG